MISYADQEKIQSAMGKLLDTLQDVKPNDRSDMDRNFAIAITDAEKLNAWISQVILMD